jgi:hypothetical protein
MTTNQPAILSALERVIGQAKHAPRMFTSTAIVETPLIEREGNYLCSAYISDYSAVNLNPAYDETITKVRCDTFEVVYWADHPVSDLIEYALEAGDLQEEDIDDDYDNIPQAIVDEAEDTLKQWIVDEIWERLDMDVEVISAESKSYSRRGGWSVIVKSKDLYSVDCQLAAKARVVNV